MFDGIKNKLIKMDKECERINNNGNFDCGDCKYFNECNMGYCPEEALEIINNAENIIKLLNNKNTKQVVIGGVCNCTGRLLPPYYMNKYLKSIGLNIGLVEKNMNTDEFNKINLDSYKSFDKTYYKINGVDKITSNIFNYFELKEMIDREDEELVKIAKEVNNEDYLKIIELPQDVEYEIIQNECCGGETIVEKHREWN